VIAVAGSIVVAQSQEESPKKDDLIFASAEKATFKEVSPGISKAAVWGDEVKGAYGAFTKFKPGVDNGMLLSLVVMNYHFVSDVIAGAFLGAIVATYAVHLASLKTPPLTSH
jgi:hypothetical protein